MTSRSMSGTRVLVTGGSSGLGAALVAAYRARGARVLVTDLGSRPRTRAATTSHLDVRSDGDWQRAVAWVDEHWGGLDILVNNAGSPRAADRCRPDGGGSGCSTSTSSASSAAVGPSPRCSRGPRQRADRHVASLAGLRARAGMATYSAAKAGVVALLSESLRYELAPYGISTSVVCPFLLPDQSRRVAAGSDPSATELAAG